MTFDSAGDGTVAFLEQRLFEVCAYLANSAALSLAETPSLAAFRMVDAAHRMVDLVQEVDPTAADFYREAAADYAAHFNLVMQDQDAFDRWLPSFGAMFTTEAVRRARQAQSGNTQASSEP